ncbi:progesterone receptor isoform X2 [Emydura macquarii macquarii]|uniref:progesterone receptor isoform X2 n=1 Tax=Emydura macquarii macquarii TaxID=1129001 RepID=UPI00352A4BFC
MTEMKAKDARAPSSARDGSVRLQQGRPERDPFHRGAAAVDISLHGLLYPKSSEEEEEEEEEQQKGPEGEERGPASPRAGSGSPAERDALDRVLDTFLAPSAQASSAGAPAAWCLFGAEIPEVPSPLMSRRSEQQLGGAAAAAQQGSPAANSGSLPPPAPAAASLWPDGGAPAAAAKLPPQREGEGASERTDRPRRAPAALPEEAHGFDSEGPAEQDAGSGSSLALSPAHAAASGRSAAAGSGQDFLHVPILPLNSAYLAARTRQLLDVEEYENSLFGRRASPTSTPQDFADYVYPQPDSKEEHYSYGDFQPALKIKEEGISAPSPYLGTKTTPAATCTDYTLAPPQPRASQESSSLECILYKTESSVLAGSYGPPYCKASGSTSCLVQRDSLPSTSTAPPAFYQPFSLNGHQQLGFQTAVPKESLPQIYPPYLNYIRPDTEAGQSPQYSFESVPQKICLICGDEASGCHYGVLTCGSCKVFFKRAMEGQHNYLCAGRNDCIVDKIRRKNCPACRLRKCCQAGMVLGGRKFKKFNKVKVVRTLDIVALQQPSALPDESQALTQRLSFSPNQDIQFVPPLISILQGIEPEVVYAGYDNTQPETPSALLTSLNQLCERQLLCVVKWSKSLPGFRNLHIDDQITLIQYSWMSLMVFAMGWRSYKHVSGQMLYFAPDLILNEQRMKESSFYSLCLSMWQIPQEFVKLQVSQEEFLCMKSLLLLNTIPLEGLRSQSQFDEMRASYIRELVKAIGLRQKGVVASSQRFYQLTKLMDSMHDLVKQLHLFCLNTFLQSRALSVEFPEMMSEVIAAQLPKILAGMVKPLLFHKK